MLGSPRIIAIDDQAEHLSGLVNCLNRNGVACLQIHFTGDPTGIKACPDVRIIFADLHLGPGTPSDHKADFSTLGGLIEDTIRPTGPYFIVLWTQYPGQAPGLRDFLDQRLPGKVTKPFDVLPLQKLPHIDQDGNIDDRKLMEAVLGIARQLPQLGVLFEWESQVLRAAGRTVSSIQDLASDGDGEHRTEEVGRILGRLAVEAVGKDHVDQDRFRAVNDALLPILADRVAKIPSGQLDKDLWKRAFTIPERKKMKSVPRAARLNRLVHIADADAEGGSATERGAVILLPTSHRDNFHDLFGIEEQDAATERFRCKSKEFDPNSDRFQWVLIQCQAACDYALSNPGSVPFYLGLDFPEEHRASKNPPNSTWRGPVFEFGGEIRRLRISAGFSLTLATSVLRGVTPLYRLREQILNNLAYHLHTHGARPGSMSFGK